MHEILWELRHWIVGLNAGRWDYLFSAIKTTEQEGLAPLFPDRSQLTMTAPFMRAYAEELVRVAHTRGVHAMGGMSAFIPSRRYADVNERALEQVRRDKEREASQGFDGTWVAHPDLIATAREAFAQRLGTNVTQKQMGLDIPAASREALLPSKATLPNDAELTREGLRANIDVCLRYLSAWLGGMGAVAIHNLMEDAATAEIARAQLWQACHSSLSTYKSELVLEEIESMARELSLNNAEDFSPVAHARLPQAAELLVKLTASKELISFLTLPALEALERDSSRDRIDVNRERRAQHHSPTTKGDQL
jgi:malate synthase